MLVFIQFSDFMINVSGNPDPLSVLKDYTEDTVGLLNMPYDLRVYPHLDNRTIKNRFSWIQKGIKNQLAFSARENGRRF